MSVAIKMPLIYCFEDYHDMDNFKTDLEKILVQKQKLDLQEILFDNKGVVSKGYYYGVFYLKGNIPSLEEVIELLIEEGFKPTDFDDDCELNYKEPGKKYARTISQKEILTIHQKNTLNKKIKHTVGKNSIKI